MISTDKPVPPPGSPPFWRGLLAFMLELWVFFLSYDLLYRLLIGRRGFWSESLFRKQGYLIEQPRWLLPYFAAMFLLLPLLRMLFGGWRLNEFGLQPTLPLKAAGQGTALWILALTWVNLGLLLIPGVADQAWRAYGIRSSGDLWVYLLLVSPFVAAVGEELFFRCYLHGSLGELHKSWGPLAAALIFASAHAFQGWIALLFFHVPLALVFMAIYRRTRNLWVLILAHAIFDVLMFGELFVLSKQPNLRVLICSLVLGIGLLMLWLLRNSLLEIGRELADWARELDRPQIHLWWVLAFGALFALFQQLMSVHNPRALRWFGLPLVLLALFVAIVGRWIARPAGRSDGMSC